MAIADGQKVCIKFTQALVGNVTGLNPPIGYKSALIDLKNAAITTLNQYNTSYSGAKAVDSDVSTYWRGTTAVNWFRIQFPEAKVVTQLRLYLASYYIKTFTFSGSNDGETWTQIGGEYAAATSTTGQWYTFEIENDDAYLYYRIDTLTTYSSRVYIYELELYETVAVGNETKFTVSFDEYNYVPGGSRSRVVRGVSQIGVVDANTIVLYFDSGTPNSIQRAVGDITVAYDGSGTLVGEGGPVAAFEHTFTPEGLDPKNNPHDAEHLEIADIVATGILKQIFYTNTSESEHIELSDISAVGVLTRIEDI